MKYIKPNWNAPSSIMAFTTTRSSWGQDEPKSPAQQQKLKEILNLPSDPIWLTQTHSNQVVMAKPEQSGVIADASFTEDINRVCVILTADCLPVLLCNKQGTSVAAIHAGWRGLSAGIIENTVMAMHQPPQDLIAWLGPAIGPKHFEVGKEVLDAFTIKQPEAIKAFTPHQSDKWFADLYTLATLRLSSLGVNAIYGGNFCTYSQADLFPSYRRDQKSTQRIATTIWIKAVLR